MIKSFRKYHTRQQDQSDCGVVCLKTILKYFNSTQPLEKLRKLSGTTNQGTTMLGLLQCGNEIGLEVKAYETTINSLKEITFPTILHTIFEENLHHYIVCFGYDKNKDLFIISNPANFKIGYIDEKELKKILASKSLLLCKETDILIKNKSNKKQKLKWLFSHIKEDLNLLFMSLFLGVLIAILSLATAIYSQKLIDVLLPSKDNFKIFSSICLLLFLFIIQAFFGYLRNLFLIRQTKRYNNRVIEFFYSNIIKLPIVFFGSRKVGDMIARMNDTSRIQKVISKIIGSILIDFLLILSVTVVIFNYNFSLGLISLTWLPLVFIIIILFNNKIKLQQKEVMESYSRNESNYINTIQGIEAIKSNNREHIFINKTNTIYKLFQKSIYRLGLTSLDFETINHLISSIFITGILVYSTRLVLNGELTTGVIIALLQLVSVLMVSTMNLSLLNIEIQEAKVAFDRMYEFTSMTPEARGQTAIETFISLDIKNLSFRFAGRSPLLKNINLSVPKYQCIAIVGESGSGKSTLGQILQKFYPFEKGEITVNGTHALETLKTTDWRNLLGVVPQEVTIFNVNVLDNILMGQDDTPDRIEHFCKSYGFDTFIQSLPQGFATILGEEGINLSGGQKQMIALMRVLYKQPQLLLLDEFTSALDRNTEQFVLDLLNVLKSKLTIIFISHRLHALPKIADTIYVIENGEIGAFGTHNALMQTTNFYSEFWKTLEIN